MSAAFLFVVAIVFLPILFLLARTPLHDSVPVITGTAPLYSVAALVAWSFFNAPGAGIHQMPLAIVALVVVLIPYALLLLVHRRNVDALSRAAMTFGSVALALVALWAYWPAFLHYDVGNDGEYGLVFWAAPGVQAMLVLASLGLVLSRRRFSKRKAIIHDQTA